MARLQLKKLNAQLTELTRRAGRLHPRPEGRPVQVRPLPLLRCGATGARTRRWRSPSCSRRSPRRRCRGRCRRRAVLASRSSGDASSRAWRGYIEVTVFRPEGRRARSRSWCCRMAARARPPIAGARGACASRRRARVPRDGLRGRGADAPRLRRVRGRVGRELRHLPRPDYYARRARDRRATCAPRSTRFAALPGLDASRVVLAGPVGGRLRLRRGGLARRSRDSWRVVNFAGGRGSQGPDDVCGEAHLVEAMAPLRRGVARAAALDLQRERPLLRPRRSRAACTRRSCGPGGKARVRRGARLRGSTATGTSRDRRTTGRPRVQAFLDACRRRHRECVRNAVERRTAASALSFEFFPPKTPEGVEKLRATRRAARRSSKPDFFSVTYGAGGSTREGTLATVLRDPRRRATTAAPHLSCVASTRDSMLRSDRGQYRANGHPPHRGAARRHALAAWPRRATSATPPSSSRSSARRPGDAFHIEVACYPEYHPQARKAQAGPRRLQGEGRRGRELGDHAVLLQRRRLLPLRRAVPRRWASTCRSCRASCRSTNFSQLARFSDACGAEIPRWMRLKLEGFGDDTRLDQGLRPRRGDRALRPPARRRARRACTSTR